MANYWLITTRDDRHIYIPPDKVAVVKRRMDVKLPVHTNQGSIPSSEIRSFDPSEKPYSDTPLLEAASRAFNEPIHTEDGIAARWVKKDVPTQIYEKRYAKTPGYKFLRSNYNMVTIAFALPVHLIPEYVEYCTEEEINILDKKQ